MGGGRCRGSRVGGGRCRGRRVGGGRCKGRSIGGGRCRGRRAGGIWNEEFSIMVSNVNVFQGIDVGSKCDESEKAQPSQHC